MNAWVVPTARATVWLPLVASACLLLIIGTLVRVIGASPAWLLGLGAAAMAAALVAGLHDPAASLLAAMPTSAARRRVQRLLLLVPASMLAWVALVGIARLMTPGWASGWSFGPAVALAATAIAVAVWTPPDSQVGASVAAPMLWYILTQVAGGSNDMIGDIVTAWEQHPWVIAGAATALAIGGRNR